MRQRFAPQVSLVKFNKRPTASTKVPRAKELASGLLIGLYCYIIRSSDLASREQFSRAGIGRKGRSWWFTLETANINHTHCWRVSSRSQKVKMIQLKV